MTCNGISIRRKKRRKETEKRGPFALAAITVNYIGGERQEVGDMLRVYFICAGESEPGKSPSEPWPDKRPESLPH